MATEEQIYTSYDESPAKFNKWCHNQWDSYFEKFKDRIRENWQGYNNYSEDLAERKNDETLSRSCLFIPQMNPAILSRVAHKTSLITSVDTPIKVFPKPGTSRETAENIQELVKDLLTKADFRKLILKMELAQEIWPIVFLMISEDYEEKMELKIFEEKLRIYGIDESFLEKQWKLGEKKWKVRIDVLLQNQVFYDVHSSSWEDKQYAGTVNYLTLAELISRKETHEYKFEEEDLKTNGKIVQIDEFGDELKSDIKGETKKDQEGVRRYQVLENWAIILKPDGTILRKRITSTGDVKLREVDFPYNRLDIPLIPVVCYPNINQLEGITTADNTKYIQAAINDAFNMTYDAAKYNIFPPRLKDSRVMIMNDEIIAPGAEWEVKLPSGVEGKPTDYIQPLYTPSPTGKDYFVLYNILAGLLQQVANAPGDVLQGISSDVDEKATKTRIRQAGASTRLMGINVLSDVEVLKKLGFMVWMLALEHLDVNDKYMVDAGYDENGEAIPRILTLGDIMGEVNFAVPHLEGIMDQVEKEAKLKEFYLMVANEPFFNPGNPVTLKARYEFLRRIAEAGMVPDFDKILPPDIVEKMTGQDLLGNLGLPPVISGGEKGSPLMEGL